MHPGGGSREGFVKDFRLVDSGIERRFRNERFDRTVRMKREKGYLEIPFRRDNKYPDVFLINISFHILQHGLFNVSRECLED